MSERIEYPKKLTFSSKAEMDLFEGIVNAHKTDNNHKSEGDFIMFLLKKEYMPKDEKAKEFCARLYRRNKNNSFKEKVFEVLKDVFVHLTTNIKTSQYSRNFALVYFISTIVDKEWKISNKGTEGIYDTIRMNLLNLCNDSYKKSEKEKTPDDIPLRDYCADIKNLVNNNEFSAWELLKILSDNYVTLSEHTPYYSSLVFICDILSSEQDVSEQDRYHLISLIKNMSSYWAGAKK